MKNQSIFFGNHFINSSKPFPLIIYWFLGEFWCFDFCDKGEVPLRKVSAYGNYPLAEARLHKAGTLSWTQESMSSKQYSVDTSIYGVLVAVSVFSPINTAYSRNF